MKSDFIKLIDELEDIKKRHTLEHSQLMVWDKPSELGFLMAMSGFGVLPDIRYLELGGFIQRTGGKNVQIHDLVLCSIGGELNQELAEISRQAVLLIPDREYELYGIPKDAVSECRWLMCLFCYMERNKNKWIVYHKTPDMGGGLPGHTDLIKPCEASIIYLEYLAKNAPKKRTNRTKIIKDRHEVAWNLLNKNPELNIRELAEKLDCSPATARKAPAWKELQSKRNKEKAARKPKVVGLTDKSLQVLGRKDGELEKLMESQERDYDPSPLTPKGRSPINRREL